MRRAALSLALLLVVTPALALSNAPYLTTSDVDLLELLPPPPAKGSPADAADMATVLAVQKARTPEQVAQVIANSPLSIFQFADVMGPQFTKQNLPKLDAFFTKLTIDANAVGVAAKDAWARPRPFENNPAVEPPGDLKKSVLNLRGEMTYSYPSGHAGFGVLAAIFLSEMVPEKRAQLFTRAWDFGNIRVASGLHYPSDVEGGRLYGVAVATALMQKPAFRADLAEARAELRTALKLAP